MNVVIRPDQDQNTQTATHYCYIAYRATDVQMKNKKQRLAG
jgi:hypothetical protein